MVCFIRSCLWYLFYFHFMWWNFCIYFLYLTPKDLMTKMSVNNFDLFFYFSDLQNLFTKYFLSYFLIRYSFIRYSLFILFIQKFSIICYINLCLINILFNLKDPLINFDPNFVKIHIINYYSIKFKNG